MSNGYHTDLELMISHAASVYILDKLLREHEDRLDEFIDMMPGIFHTNRKEDLAIRHLNKDGEEWSQLTGEEMNEMGAEYLEKNLHPDTLKQVIPRFKEFYRKKDDNKICTEFQKVLNPRTNEYETFFTVTKPFKKRDLFITSSNPVNIFGRITKKLRRIAGEEIFVRRHFRQFQSLTKREVEILTLLAEGNNNPQIAEILFISRHTVAQHRKNINRKLEIDSFADLFRYAQAFDLVRIF